MRSKIVKASKVLQGVFFVFFWVLCSLIVKELWETQHFYRMIDEVRIIAAEEPSADWSNGLSTINPDYVGWLEVDGTQISYPVVCGKNNDYYLSHDFYKEDNHHGCLFLDMNCRRFPQYNPIIYGHNMKDGTMFGMLDEFRQSSFFEQHRLVKWVDEYGEHWYQLFAAAVLPGDAAAEDYIDVGQWSGAVSTEAVTAMRDSLAAHATIWQDVPNGSASGYLYLITCDYTKTDGRLILAGREITSSIGGSIYENKSLEP